MISKGIYPNKYTKYFDSITKEFINYTIHSNKISIR